MFEWLLDSGMHLGLCVPECIEGTGLQRRVHDYGYYYRRERVVLKIRAGRLTHRRVLAKTVYLHSHQSDSDWCELLVKLFTTAFLMSD
jgi:hypothetical protein